jgi:hypothetical protein
MNSLFVLCLTLIASYLCSLCSLVQDHLTKVGAAVPSDRGQMAVNSVLREMRCKAQLQMPDPDRLLRQLADFADALQRSSLRGGVAVFCRLERQTAGVHRDGACRAARRRWCASTIPIGRMKCRSEQFWTHAQALSCPRNRVKACAA